MDVDERLGDEASAKIWICGLVGGDGADDDYSSLQSEHRRMNVDSSLWSRQGAHRGYGAVTSRGPEHVGQDTTAIYFYNRGEPYFEFTNFSDHPIFYNKEEYPTAEHLFQAFKFLEHHPETAQLIRHQPTARRARDEAGRLRRLQRSDWFDTNVAIMDRVLELKFTQHPELARMLLATSRRQLVEDSPDDMFWGVGRDHTGRNELGKALMRLRDRLANAS